MYKATPFMHLVRGVAVVMSILAGQAGAQTQPVLQSAPAAPPAAAAVAAPAAAMGSLQGSSIVGQNYIIGPNDVLQITVWKEPNVSQPNVPVRPDGKITVPLVGDIAAAGVTPTELAANITRALGKLLTEPLVTVGVVSVYPKEIYVMGEVMHVGSVLIVPGMTPLQALAAAGGLSMYASKKLYILRGSGSNQKKIPFDYKKAIRTGDQQGITLQPGDTVVVP